MPAQITALHRRSLLKHSKKFIGQGRVPLVDLGAVNAVALQDKHLRPVGTVNFEIKALVPLDSGMLAQAIVTAATFFRSPT